ncbi:TPA: SEC-C domain-containing protein [Pseudomonas aeruginosa]
MSNSRNELCTCGSGRKFKKCCLSAGNITAPIIFSETLQAKLDTPCWHHGTPHKFNSWSFPPPPKPGESLLVPHTAVFFTSNMEFAKGAGNNIARVSLSSKAKILDTTENHEASEKLRKEVAKHEIASRTLNTEHDYWHEGWRTGDVLKVAYSDPLLELHFIKLSANLSKITKLPLEAATAVIQHNSARGLIELICVTAKKLGFDAIYGHEVDRHSFAGKKIAQPWLAVLSNGIISEPEWLHCNDSE